MRGTTTWIPTGASGVPLDDTPSDDGGGIPWLLLILAGGTAVALGSALALRVRARRARN